MTVMLTVAENHSRAIRQAYREGVASDPLRAETDAKKDQDKIESALELSR